MLGSILLLGGVSLRAQTGSIQGLLLDPQGGVIPNAKIIATDEAKQVVAREGASGADGRFYLRNLLPGRYTVRSEVTGFKALERKGYLVREELNSRALRPL